ncbi:T9SS type A sorting domain-containing protein [Epilithonimonas hungarica]|uniref:Por secretion system C-terminal sorting domain-containing protein n=1 Tax=Epilithonimonas hungarica TaxID=454006 RepID=A0A1G7GAI8_9FLAO|nr:T9SS type A sorting domain-containing protein [Epilithonimonas hungarica]SDE85146.1 Por secretion system C-terminal sorting domain-containing protein [Epilithonimonas hungarica]
MKKILFFLLISNFLFSQWSISNAERNALVSIYNATDGENWNRTWDLEKDPKTWFGVSIKNGMVDELNLTGNALKGAFPTFVSSLTHLTKLDLSNNQLSGEVPMGISSLSSLTKLDISNNRLNGNPTNSLTGLFNVQDLALGGNSFIIPDVNGLLQGYNNIKNLNIADLGLQNIPSRITTFSNLESLILDNNPILANAYGNIAGLSKLTSLSLSGNALTQIPTQVSLLTQLTSLDLSSNNLTEQNTSGLSPLINLEWLSLESNQFSQIPAQVGLLKKLQTLNLGRNKISGGTSILAGLPALQQLFMNNNLLSGNIPSEFLAMTKLLMLNLNSNQLSGDLNDKLPEITHLSNNRFNKNQLSNYIVDYNEQTELNYSPQRYDEEKEVLGVIGQPAKLEQSLSGSEYTFTWFKNLDQKMNVTTTDLSFNDVEESDYATYTVEAYTYSILDNSVVFDLSLFRNPISLVKILGTAETAKYFNIYPNPTSDYLNIVSSKYDIQKVHIYDLSGKQMLSETKSKIDVSKLPSGVYMLIIKTQEGNKNFKFIKQ